VKKKISGDQASAANAGAIETDSINVNGGSSGRKSLQKT
jgi:hypothetical protein